jgi:hypothetical protein
VHQEIALKPLPGERDLWSYDLLEVGGQLQCTSIRTFLYYLASRQTQAVRVVAYQAQTRFAHLECYGPICDEGGPLWVEIMMSTSAKSRGADNNIATLSLEEFNTLRKELREHIKMDHPEFPKKGICEARRLFGALGIPYVI